MRPAAIVLGLIAVLWANYYLRSTLEDSPRYLYSFLETFYAKELPDVFAMPTWRLFLPLKQVTGAWAATTLIVVYLTEKAITSPGAWYLFNALSILTIFGTSWILFRSAVFTFTAAICVGFGTQFYQTYAVTGGIASPLLLTYHTMLLFGIVQVVRGVTPRWLWWLVFALGLFVNFFGYEGWLDVLVLVWVSLPFACIGLRRLECLEQARRLARVTAGLTAAGMLYIFVKVTYGFGQVEGSESDVLFNYDSWRLVMDDLISNAFTHTYLAVSNFLPPALVGSTGMFHLGAQHLIDAQHQYHEPFQYLVPMHQVFYWRYYAGAVFVLLCGSIVSASKRMWRRPTPWTLALIVILLMLLVPGSTHSVIKFRPMNAMPVMTYHVTLGIIGASLLIAWLTTTAWRGLRVRPLAVAVVIGVWLTVLYGALARPAYLAYMAAQSGLGEFVYPNPMKALLDRLGWQYDFPRGMALYRLMPYQRDEALSRARSQLADLPGRLPSAREWPKLVETFQTADAPNGGIEVTGDDSQFGYQLMSPPIPVQPSQSYIVRYKFEMVEGRVCVGIISGDQQRWLVPPDGTTVEYAFNAGTLDAVRVVLANCNLSDLGNRVTKVRAIGGSYAMVQPPGAQP